MNSVLPLAIRCGDRAYELIRPLVDGRVRLADSGADFKPRRADKDDAPDAAELSFSAYVARQARGDGPHLAIPVYLSRAFRHGDIYIRADRGIRTPADLRGRRIGSDDYNFTAYVWLRALLDDEYGVRPDEVTWVLGRQEKPNAADDPPLTAPPGVTTAPPSHGESLSDMLEAGEIDALLNPATPSCFARGAVQVTRLFADPQAVADDHRRRSGVFPIVHILGLRAELAASYPGLPLSLYRALQEARRITALPRPTHELFGFGEGERKTMEFFLRYHHAHGLSPRRLTIEELFAPVPLSAYGA